MIYCCASAVGYSMAGLAGCEKCQALYWWQPRLGGRRDDDRTGRASATAATWPAVLTGEGRRPSGSYPRSTLVVRPEPTGSSERSEGCREAEAKSNMRAAGHRQVAD